MEDEILRSMRLPKLRIATILTWVIVVALALALLAQHQSGERHDRVLKTQLGQALMDKYAQEGMNRILTDQGTDIFKHCQSVELLRISGSTVTSTGIMLEKDVALRVACVLLDHRNFWWANSFDDPIPQVGLRIKDGHSTLDISIGWEGPSHQDVWITIYDQAGKQVHWSGRDCMGDSTLQLLGEELLSLLHR